MKIPTARRLPSGSWHCRVRVQGKDIPITRATKKEAVAEAMAVKSGIKTVAINGPALLRAKTVCQAIDDYIAVRENVLSPSTIRGYRAIQHNRFLEAMALKIYDISKAKWQRIVNAEAPLCSAKTLKNAWGFISSVITETTGETIRVRLPQVVERDLPYLDPEQISTFLQAVHGRDIEIPALLGLSGLRRSEILALRWENVDLEKGEIFVVAAAVENKYNKLVQKKETKNKKSRRTVHLMSPQLISALREAQAESGLVCTINPKTLWKKINQCCEAAGLPKVGIHGLRRSFATLAYHLGLSEEWTMREGGWSNIYVMRKIYTKISEHDVNDQARKMQDFYGQI